MEKYINIVKPFYFETHRKFHSWDHIKSGLELFDSIKNYSLEQNIAWLYHDIIYNPLNTDNEDKSAKKAIEDIHSNNDAILINTDIVSIIINDTKKHIPTIEESKIVLDIDMSSLAISNYEEFFNLRILAAEEYSFLGKDILINGTKKFLKETLSSNLIFHSKNFEHLNEIAFFNLEKYYNDFEKNPKFLNIFTKKNKLKL